MKYSWTWYILLSLTYLLRGAVNDFFQIFLQLIIMCSESYNIAQCLEKWVTAGYLLPNDCALVWDFVYCFIVIWLNTFSILNSTVKNLHGTSVPMCGKETSQPLCIKNIQSTMYFHEAVINRSGCRSQVSWCSVTSDPKPDFLF